jgi:uncharacterized HAD superfamily protein
MTRKRIGLDLDGVLVNFYDAYEGAIRRETGRDLFPTRAKDEYPPTWDWPEYHGYSQAEIRDVWQAIHADPEFWYRLEPLPDWHVAYQLIRANVHDVYFITARPTESALAETQRWLAVHGGTSTSATTLISPHKGLCAKALDLDIYVDDRIENILDVWSHSPVTRAYLIDRPYNQSVRQVRRAVSLRDILDKEGLLPDATE